MCTESADSVRPDDLTPCLSVEAVSLAGVFPGKGQAGMTKRIARFTARISERGATAVEYGLMVALIAIVIIVAVALLGGNLSALFNSVAGSI
jgi:pilus assembly protein Flp/PilA